MGKDHILLARELSEGAKELKKAVPNVMSTFGQLGKAVYSPGALETKIKELIALAISVAGHCDGCIAYHTSAARRKGATREEVAETVGIAIQMGGGPSMVYGAEALRAFDQFTEADGGPT